MPASSPEQIALEALAAYLLRRMGPGAVLRVVSLEIVAGGLLQEITLRPGSLAVSSLEGRQTEESQEANTPALTPTMRAIIAVLEQATAPLKGEAVSRRAGKNYTGHFRTALRQLRDRGVVLLLEGGYWLAARANGADSQ